jgi:RHS repeat-associated protein
LNGNRTKVNGTVVAGYDAQDRMTSYGANEYSYTAGGDLVAKTTPAGTTSYVYDLYGSLRQATLGDGTVLDYVVDGNHRRVGKKRNGVLEQAWLYDGQLRPIAELDGAGNIVGVFMYGERSNLPEAMARGGNTYRIVSDHLGSVRLVVDAATGNVVQAMSYDAWGNVLSDSAPGFQPFGFAGGLYDRDLALVRFGARDYDPETGRWTSKDPLRFDGGLNLYLYVGGDPLNQRDSEGTGKSSPENRRNTCIAGILLNCYAACNVSCSALTAAPGSVCPVVGSVAGTLCAPKCYQKCAYYAVDLCDRGFAGSGE